jgi:hypothetical protein
MSDTSIKQFNPTSSPPAGAWALWSDLTVSGSDGLPMVLTLHDAWSQPTTAAPAAAGTRAAPERSPQQAGSAEHTHSANANAAAVPQAADPSDEEARALLDFAVGLADPGDVAEVEDAPAPADVAPRGVESAPAADAAPVVDSNSEEACAKAFAAAMAAALAADGLAQQLADTVSSAPASHAT